MKKKKERKKEERLRDQEIICRNVHLFFIVGTLCINGQWEVGVKESIVGVVIWAESSSRKY